MNNAPTVHHGRVGAVESGRSRGLSVNRGHEVLGLLGTGDAPEGQCGCCYLAQWASGGPSVTSVEYVDEDVVVISDTEVSGLVVLPRRHIGSLEMLPPHDRANVLAVLRRATRSVSEGSAPSSARIAVLDDPSASQGHLCLYVAPAAAESAMDSSSRAV